MEDQKSDQKETPGQDTLQQAPGNNVAEIESLNATIENQKKIIADHKATIEEYGKAISEHEATIDAKTAKIVEQSAALKKLQAGNPEATVKEIKPEVKKKPEMPKEPVEHDGKKYRFRFRAFYFKAVRYEAQDVAIDEKLIAEILSDKNQTLLKEVF